MRLCLAVAFIGLLLLLCCSRAAALLDFENESAAILRSARARPLILSPSSGSVIAHDGIIRVRIVVPALARTACARASALTLLVDGAPLASQPLPPRSPHPFHLAFDIDVASLHLQQSACELLVQLADADGAALGEAAAVEISILPPADASSVFPPSASPDDPSSATHPAERIDHAACSSHLASSWGCNDDRGCNSAGKCVRGVCQCQPDWYGATCSVKPDQSSEYLPATDPLRDASVRCAETLRHARVAARLRGVIGDWRERPSDCTCFEGGDDAGSCPIVGSVPLYGIGAQIRHATRLLHTALSEGRPLVLVPERGVDARMVSFAPCLPLPEWISRSAPSHTHVDLGHAFNGWKSEMATPDNATAHGFPLRVVCVFLATHSCSPHLRLRASSQISRLLPNQQHWRYLAPEFSLPPPEFAAAGTLAFRSELTSSLLTPLPWFDAVLASHAAMLGLTSPGLGVHLRRGDACMHSEWDPSFRPSCASVAEYVDAAVIIIRRYNPASIFVSSDDSSAAAEFEAALGALGFDVPIATANVGEMYQGGGLLEDRVGWDGVDAADIAWTTLRDVFMLARSEYFVVNFASQLSRVAFELAVSRRSGLLPPYISVDGFPWCDAPCDFGRRRQRAVAEAISTASDAMPQC